MAKQQKDRLQAIIDQLTKSGIAASTLDDESSPCVVIAFLSTGTYVLDSIMGGGLPLGRVVEIYGDTSTGKSLLAAQACASCQEDGGVAVYIDTETAVSLPIMQAVGVDVESLVYMAPDTVEDVFKAMEIAIENKGDEVMLIVWDSIAATSARAEMDKDTGAVGYMTHARIISQGLRKLTRLISRQQVSVLFLNQAKTNIGVLFGDKVATFGGKSIGFHSSIRIMMSGGKSYIKDSKKRVLGITAKAKVVKNKIAPPFREAELPIYFGHGVDDAEAAFLYLKKAGMLEPSGRSYTMPLKGKELKFTKKSWEVVHDQNYDIICDIIDKITEGLDLL